MGFRLWVDMGAGYGKIAGFPWFHRRNQLIFQHDKHEYKETPLRGVRRRYRRRFHPGRIRGRRAGTRGARVLPTRSDLIAHRGAGLPAQHGARRPRCQGSAALRDQGTGRCAERAHRARGRHGLRHAERLRRTGAHAVGGPPRQPRPALQPVPHHRALLAHADGPALRPQPPHEQHGQHHRDGHGLSGQYRTATRRRRAARGDAAPERLQHRLLRQEPRDGTLGSQRFRPDRPLADALGLRQVLRLLRRRDRPVESHAL